MCLKKKTLKRSEYYRSKRIIKKGVFVVATELSPSQSKKSNLNLPEPGSFFYCPGEYVGAARRQGQTINTTVQPPATSKL
jgi:hypothetical protein